MLATGAAKSSVLGVGLPQEKMIHMCKCVTMISTSFTLKNKPHRIGLLFTGRMV